VSVRRESEQFQVRSNANQAEGPATPATSLLFLVAAVKALIAHTLAVRESSLELAAPLHQIGEHTPGTKLLTFLAWIQLRSDRARTAVEVHTNPGLGLHFRSGESSDVVAMIRPPRG
jgi:hypothetical protein